MKTSDVSIFQFGANVLWIFCMFTFFPSLSLAELKALDKALKHEELVLTLSDDVIMSEDEYVNTRLTGHRKLNQGHLPKNKPVNLGCGMDLSPFGNTNDNDNSFSSRLVGECSFNYKY